ncbi:MAG: hypothetical protein WCZ43_03140 [Proteiniphilum sp.]
MTNKINRGSEWRRWDLHVHTKGTNKNDQFKSESFEEFCKILFRKALENEITAIGITDYFSIEKYLKTVNFIKYIDSVEGFNPEEKSKIKDILLLPNVELRMLPSTDKGGLINIHCIFNPDYVEDIENNFFNSIEYSAGSGKKFQMNRKGLIDLGKYIDSDLDESAAYDKGVNIFVVTHSQLQELLDENKNFRENVIIAVSNSNKDGVSAMQNHFKFFEHEKDSSLEAVRKSIYHLSDIIFSGNPNDREYFLGLKGDDQKTVIQNCGSLKPCIHGSDAHTEDKLFNPDERRYCWIKANPTFEGLKQVIYEPADRVRIQALKPDVKNDRFIISELRFKDSSEELFGNQVIPLNENLNSIIGGKSSGKSLFLYSTAKSIDPEQVAKTDKRLGFDGYSFDDYTYDFEVVWKNGDIDSLNSTENKHRKIIYIPQLYINYLVERDNKEDLNVLVKNILLQDTEFKGLYEEKSNKVYSYNIELDRLLTSYIFTRQQALNLSAKSREIGRSNEIKSSIEKIQKQIDEGQKQSNFSDDDFKKYKRHLGEVENLKTQQSEIDRVKGVVKKILEELSENKASLLGTNQTSDYSVIKGSIDILLEKTSDIDRKYREDLLSIRNKIEHEYSTIIVNYQKEAEKLKLTDKAQEVENKIKEVENNLKPYHEILKSQTELKKLTDNLEKEKIKLENAIRIERQFDLTFKEYGNIRDEISKLLSARIKTYEEIISEINEKRKDIGGGVSLESSLIFKRKDLQLYDQVNKSAISKEHFFNKLFSDGILDYKQIPNIFSRQLYIQDNSNILKDGKDENFELPLNKGHSLEDVLRGLIQDNFIIDFSVKYQGDDLLRMSPGKKGTVLLILILKISSSEYPILIDQPEDNLDNRTIYDLLCKIIKEKKKERQIIIVSHNANLVVATDSENVIVANQAGQNNNGENQKYQFEYTNGAIEDTRKYDSSIQYILQQQGIREHVCDILEGGNEAFKNREVKYSIKI